MSEYEGQVWDSLNEHWQRRNNRRGLPNWASNALGRTGEAAGNAARRVSDAVPEAVTKPIRRAGDAVADKAMSPALAGAAALLELVNDWAMELNDPKNVEKLARKRGFDIDALTELRDQDLKVCDRLLSRNTLRWRTTGAFEGGARPAGHGPRRRYPRRDDGEHPGRAGPEHIDSGAHRPLLRLRRQRPLGAGFIQCLVQRSFMGQAAKAKHLHETARAASAVKGRLNWSQKLRRDHRLLAALDKLMRQMGPAGSRVSVKNVAKVVPFVGVLVGASINAAVLGRVAADAQRYCQTRFLCDKFGLPLPAALATDEDDDFPTDET
ncbi:MULTISPECIES: hypothetical protein [Streptomyces albovinaceus subgroup]|uniref:hypothetical protein n=1 Tax=Streptomyces albovinaceus subgroup TaxID=1482558 RepID=UPI001F1C89EB|nr:hypothetical protein [Streptomyces mediolani]WSF75228.1 hypothetical protein OG838_03260 [Streptomyces globisporus]WSQ90329.1 hypothetical protein OG425_02475 [Streptomyces globisporus]WSV88306.1 hypothetical protein OG449_02650 [Streptomyces globisporus]